MSRKQNNLVCVCGRQRLWVSDSYFFSAHTRPLFSAGTKRGQQAERHPKARSRATHIGAIGATGTSGARACQSVVEPETSTQSHKGAKIPARQSSKYLHPSHQLGS